MVLCCKLILRVYHNIYSNNPRTILEDKQEWHVVPLLGDVPSPTTVAHYVSKTSDLRVLRTAKH